MNISNEIDGYILSLLIKSNGSLDPAKTSKIFLIKHNIYDYIINRFDDTDNIPEILYRIKHNIINPPKCIVCGKPSKFKSFGSGYGKLCSTKCNMKAPESLTMWKKSRNKNKKIFNWNIINLENDEEILRIFLINKNDKFIFDGNKKEHLKWATKNINIINYIKNRYNDSADIIENVYRLYHNLYEKPKCIVCGNDVKFKGFIKGYNKTCSHRCKTLNPDTREKLIKTNNVKFGTDYSLSNINIRNKAKQTKLEKYGDENFSNNKQAKLTMLKKYGVEYAYFLPNNKKYSIQNKRASSGEVLIYKLLLKYFNEYDIIFQYKDNRYMAITNKPAQCDFYIKSKDLFIEVNLFSAHGPCPYNINNLESLNALNKMTIEWWKKIYTINDPFKRNSALTSNLNYIEIFKSDLYNKMEKAIKKIESYI